jgi:thiol peroxidase
MKNMTTTFKGTPIRLEGHFPQAGETAPDFFLTKNDLSDFSLKDGEGEYLILNIFPSLDTGVCATTVRRFNQMAASLPGAMVLCISKDLPFAQNRFCAAEGIEHTILLSDFRYTSRFGKDYGVLITSGPMRGLLARAVVIIDPKGKVIYSELVSEVTREPNYEAALRAVK